MVMSVQSEKEFGQYELDIINNKKSAILYFFADWCIPCKTVSTLVEAQSCDSNDNIIWLKINTEEAPNVVKQYKVKGLPSLIFFKEGEMYSRMTGNINNHELTEKLTWFKEGL